MPCLQGLASSADPLKDSVVILCTFAHCSRMETPGNRREYGNGGRFASPLKARHATPCATISGLRKFRSGGRVGRPATSFVRHSPTQWFGETSCSM